MGSNDLTSTRMVTEKMSCLELMSLGVTNTEISQLLKIPQTTVNKWGETNTAIEVKRLANSGAPENSIELIDCLKTKAFETLMHLSTQAQSESVRLRASTFIIENFSVRDN